MVTVQLEVVLENLNKIKKTIQTSFENANGGGNKKGASAFGIGAAVSILDKLLKSTQSIVGLLEIIGGLINQLVAPFVPILLGLIKPVFILLQRFLFATMATLGVSGFGASGEEGSTIVKVGTIIAAIVGGIVGIFASATVSGAIALGIAAAIGSVALFDLGLWLGDKLGDLVTGAARGIADSFSSLWNILMESWNQFSTGLSESFSSLWNILVGVWDSLSTTLSDSFSSLWNLLSSIFINAFGGLWDILKGAWNGLKGIWETFLSIMKQAVLNFGNLFIDGLNALIKLLNKIPGVDIGSIGRFGGGQDLQTTINVTVQGNTNEETVDTLLKELRKQQQRRGLGSFN